MGRYEQFVPVEVRTMIDNAVDTARGNIEKDRVLYPVAFIGRFDGAVTVIDLGAAPSKDDAARVMRFVAKKIDADYILHIDEIWLLQCVGKDAQDAYLAQRDAGKEVREMDGRIDAVMFNLQTHVGLFGATIPRETKGDTYTFGKPDFEMMDGAEGRFVGLLPARGGKQ